MRKFISTIVLALGLVLAEAPAVFADDCCGPVSDALATQDPVAYGAIEMPPCATRKSVDCAWDVISRPGAWGQSYFRIRVGHRVCIKYWDPKINRKYGHCSPIGHHNH